MKEVKALGQNDCLNLWMNYSMGSPASVAEKQVAALHDPEDVGIGRGLIVVDFDLLGEDSGLLVEHGL